MKTKQKYLSVKIKVWKYKCKSQADMPRWRSENTVLHLFSTWQHWMVLRNHPNHLHHCYRRFGLHFSKIRTILVPNLQENVKNVSARRFFVAQSQIAATFVEIRGKRCRCSPSCNCNRGSDPIVQIAFIIFITFVTFITFITFIIFIIFIQQ